MEGEDPGNCGNVFTRRESTRSTVESWTSRRDSQYAIQVTDNSVKLTFLMCLGVAFVVPSFCRVETNILMCHGCCPQIRYTVLFSLTPYSVPPGNVPVSFRFILCSLSLSLSLVLHLVKSPLLLSLSTHFRKYKVDIGTMKPTWT